ncbi:amino acid permease [Kribbella sindirgiensis]|uniref:Amino acid permease n=1 Tax=Kribbella sindirgiensis TaxID=1124744 RepID=A0A4R0I679_9ACTN|nr:amino acid permease [Kribbella sindirgiensis]
MSRVTETASGRLSLGQGTALYIGAVLATGVIALPGLAAEVAGPASLLAWLGLAVVSAPLAATFAALGARYPDSGGIATYARLAFGERAAAIVGWCFYLSVPVGGPAAALWAGGYVESALGGGRGAVFATMLALLAIVPAANAFGIEVTGRVQMGLAGLLTVFLGLAVALSLPHADLSNLQPFAPHGWQAIGPAAALLVWSFVGWETVTYLTAEFRRPARDVPRATAVAVIVVGVIYLSVAFATITVLGPRAADTDAPLGDLLAIGLGGNARVLAAAAALLLTFGAMNAYYAGASKLGAALARDGALPAWLARGSSAGVVPRRSLAVLSAMSMLTAVVVVVAGLEPESLVLLTTGLFVTVYAVGVAAAVKLLPRRSRARLAALVAQGAVVVLLLTAGVYLLWPVLVSVAALLYLRLSHRRP